MTDKRVEEVAKILLKLNSGMSWRGINDEEKEYWIDEAKKIDALYSAQPCNCHIIRDSAVKRVAIQQEKIWELESKLKSVDARFERAVGEDIVIGKTEWAVMLIEEKNYVIGKNQGKAEIRKRWQA